jgi:uncharacterized membrane protein
VVVRVWKGEDVVVLWVALLWEVEAEEEEEGGGKFGAGKVRMVGLSLLVIWLILLTYASASGEEVEVLDQESRFRPPAGVRAAAEE